MKKTALVTGAASGLGQLIARGLTNQGWSVIPWDINDGKDVCRPDPAHTPAHLDVLVNCAGVNRISWLEHASERDWDVIMDTNAKGIFMMTKACLAALRANRGTVLNIVSNAATKPMRCSAAYNASKGAALVLSRQLARELSPEVTVFSVSPNKLSGTGMSSDIDRQVMATRGWTEDDARAYQRQGLLCRAETPVEVVAEFVCWLLLDKRRHYYLAGCDIPYGD